MIKVTTCFKFTCIIQCNENYKYISSYILIQQSNKHTVNGRKEAGDDLVLQTAVTNTEVSPC